MNNTTAWGEWVKRVATVYGFPAAERPMLLEWCRILSEQGTSPADAMRAADWVALNDPQGWRPNLLGAFSRRLKDLAEKEHRRRESRPKTLDELTAESEASNRAYEAKEREEWVRLTPEEKAARREKVQRDLDQCNQQRLTSFAEAFDQKLQRLKELDRRQEAAQRGAAP